jgi:hypothetical protein
MAHRWWVRILFVLIALPLLVWGYDRYRLIKWVGGTDLEVEFVVTDVESGDPIPEARIEVHSEGEFFAEDYKQEFSGRRTACLT